MAEFDQGQAQESPIQGAQNAVSGLADKWRAWIGDEKNRTAMMQFGISLMQPIGYGQTPLGHVGQALGSAGEAYTRRKGQDIAEEEAASKQSLRESQAIAAEAGAAGREQTATAREIAANAAAERARLYGEIGHETAVGRLQKEYGERRVIEPKLTMEEFLKERAALRGATGITGTGVGGGQTAGGAVPQQYIKDQVYTFTDSTGHTFRIRYKGGDPRNRANWGPP